MILVLGSSADKVYPKLITTLGKGQHPFMVVDEDHPELYSVNKKHVNGKTLFQIVGGNCQGKEAVGSIFVRHAVARTLDPEHLSQMGSLQTQLNDMLLLASCPIINPPSNAYSNYSKPFQVRLLAEAGFDVPQSLVTNVLDEAQSFYDECGGQVIFKGVSNMPTLAQVLRPEHFSRLGLLPNCPTLFQEYIEGIDYRVHVIGNEVFVTRLISENEDYRRPSLVNNQSIVVEQANLPVPIIEKCISFTKKLGLIVSGIDFKESPDCRLVALELNPFPQFTFYEGQSGQPITQAVVDYLIKHQSRDNNVFA